MWKHLNLLLTKHDLTLSKAIDIATTFERVAQDFRELINKLCTDSLDMPNVNVNLIKHKSAKVSKEHNVMKRIPIYFCCRKAGHNKPECNYENCVLNVTWIRTLG